MGPSITPDPPTPPTPPTATAGGGGLRAVAWIVGGAIVLATSIHAASRFGTWTAGQWGELLKTSAAILGAPVGVFLAFLVDRRKTTAQWERERAMTTKERETDQGRAEAERMRQKEADQRALFAEVLTIAFKAVTREESLPSIYQCGGRILLVDSQLVRQSFTCFVKAVQATRNNMLADVGRRAAWDKVRLEYRKLEAEILAALKIENLALDMRAQVDDVAGDDEG